MKFQLLGASSPEESVRERAHRAIAREAAAEGIVLLENNGVLPMQPQKIALYGAGSRMTVKGGSGSGDVHERYSVTIEKRRICISDDAVDGSFPGKIRGGYCSMAAGT